MNSHSQSKRERTNTPRPNDANSLRSTSRPSELTSAHRDGNQSSGEFFIDEQSDRRAKSRSVSNSPQPSHITLSSSSDDDDDNQNEDDSDSDSSSSVSIQSYASLSPSSSPPRPATISARPKPKSPSSRNLPPSSPTHGIATSQLDPQAVSPDYPLPRPPFEFDALNYAPFRNPSRPARYVPPEERELGEEYDRMEQKKEEERRKRMKEQRVSREEQEGEQKWDRKWEEVSWEKGRPRWNRGKGKETDTLHSASFFPYPHLEGLDWLKDVFVTVGGGCIDFYRCPSVSGSNTAPEMLKRVTTNSSVRAEDPDREEYLTCAWSVNTTTWPFTPTLAVAGVGRVIEVYLIGLRRRVAREDELVVHLDRTITGHGGTIYQLAFHPQRPHLLLSCSEDRTLRLWDPTLPWGSNFEVQKLVQAEIAARLAKLEFASKKKRSQQRKVSKPWLRMRPRVDGELVALMTGHGKSVFTADFHPTYPLVVSGGADGRIRLWHLPPSVFDATPTWPTPPHLYRHRPKPRLSLVDPPVIEAFFSTIHLHPGQWPTQVTFLESPVPTVLSIAPLTHPDAATIPRTSIKISTIDCLSTLPNTSFDSHLTAHDLSRSQARRAATYPSRVLETVSVKPRMMEDETDDLGFRVEKEIVLEGMNCCIGDQIGNTRNGPFKRVSTGDEGHEMVLVVSTTVFGRDSTVEDEDEESKGGLYFFRPFAGLPPTSDTSSMATSNIGSTAAANGPQAKITKKERVAKLFPEERDRTLHDFHPRLRPSFVLDYSTSRTPPAEVMEEEEEEDDEEGTIHFRCVATSPGNGEWVVGVGDRGFLALWRGKSGSRDEVEVDMDLRE